MNLKRLWISLGGGLVLFYFVAAALKVSLLSGEMVVRNLFHFVTGFALLGVFSFRRRKLSVKASLFLLLAVALVYDVADYLRHSSYIEAEMILHDLYVLLWGGVTGYFTLKKG